MVASWLYFVKHYNEYLEGDVRPWRSTHLCRWSRWSLTQTYELWIGNGLHSSLGGLRHLHCITEVSLIGYFDAGEIWWTVEPLTSQVDGKIVLGFQHLQERSKLSLPAPVYLVKPAWPWRWLRYKIEIRLRTVIPFWAGYWKDRLGLRHLQGWARRKDFFSRSSGAYNDHPR